MPTTTSDRAKQIADKLREADPKAPVHIARHDPPLHITAEELANLLDPPMERSATFRQNGMHYRVDVNRTARVAALYWVGIEVVPHDIHETGKREIGFSYPESSRQRHRVAELLVDGTVVSEPIDPDTLRQCVDGNYVQVIDGVPVALIKATDLRWS